MKYSAGGFLKIKRPNTVFTYFNSSFESDCVLRSQSLRQLTYFQDQHLNSFDHFGDKVPQGALCSSEASTFYFQVIPNTFRHVSDPDLPRRRLKQNLHLISSILLGLLLRHREAEHARFHR
jgi:hypothetical protein